ncbi:hypothetical protein PQ689_11345 [Thermoanaerobacterium thermosaccharolyticum]|uniref:hypothetical protein n=1 Tax=Thermoanaerobacterium thermosaccharolyticum TaxID=1517 RepID=UPI003D28C4CC
MISKYEGFQNKKMMSILIAIMLLIIASWLLGPITTYAADKDATIAGEKSISASSSPSGIGILASWGKVTLTWNGRNYAYATMSTYAGTAYYLYAKVSGTDGLGSIPASTNYAYNSSSTTTGKIFSRTTDSPVTWKGYGEIQDTPTSGTQTASTSTTV